MEVSDLRRLLSSLLETASNFVDAADLDQVFVQATAAIEGINDPDDLAVAQDLYLRGGLSLFAIARAAKDRGKPCKD